MQYRFLVMHLPHFHLLHLALHLLLLLLHLALHLLLQDQLLLLDLLLLPSSLSSGYKPSLKVGDILKYLQTPEVADDPSSPYSVNYHQYGQVIY